MTSWGPPSNHHQWDLQNCLYSFELFCTIYFKLLIRKWFVYFVNIKPMLILPFINSLTVVNLFLKEFIFRWPIITFLGFYNLCICMNEKVLKFLFKSKFFALLLKLLYLVIWLTKGLLVLILEKTGLKLLITFIWWQLRLFISVKIVSIDNRYPHLAKKKKA